jgi:hypothetical protein
MSEYVKNVADALFVGTAVATVAELIPLIIGCLAIVWGVYRVVDIHLAIKIKKQILKDK